MGKSQPENIHYTAEAYKNGNTTEPTTYTALLEISRDRELKKDDLAANSSHTIVLDDILQLTCERLYSFLEKRGLPRPIKLLDMGCGLGYLANELAKKNKPGLTWACDPSPSAYQFMKENFSENLNILEGDILEIAKKFKNEFDVIYLREVYPFTRHDNIGEQRRILREQSDRRISPAYALDATCGKPVGVGVVLVLVVGEVKFRSPTTRTRTTPTMD